ncbi:glycoside hydrolase family 3 N-terminal domain-containing protein [uncultured Sphaerochaeta sp.]|uniref:beta-glucosidase n=1 Tax=uncultured Sphaerochaeta sp. TaxID=886478 RepID=UPI002A0A286A|nr:glycoside hydrolase family 3 N-terminal domain-containing protein [uncultured Sphaerochaeta sp.]
MQRFELFLKKIIQRKMIKMMAPREPLSDTESMSLILSKEDEKSLPLRILQALTQEEKLSLLSGTEEFCIPGVERIGLKPVWTSDATMGLRGWKKRVTDFPATIAMAASFDSDLIKKVGKTIGEECRALGIGILLGPGVNIARVPTGGRNFEYCGEDPYLAGTMAASYIQGLQSEGIISTVKHYACNNSEYDRHKCNSVVDERTLRELYLPAFKKAIEAGAWGLMTSYNPVNGTYCSEHPYLIGEILRGEWGFEGLVISDWDSLYSTQKAVRYGVDLEMPGPKWFAPDALKKELEAGTISMADIDAKLIHIFSAYEKAGLFTRPMVDPKATVGTLEHAEVALELARESVVLLKNQDSLLPLKKRKEMVLCVGGRNSFQVPAGGGSSMIQVLEKSVNLAQRLLDEKVEVILLPTHWWRQARYRERVKSCDAVVFSTGFDNIYESESYDRQWALSKEEITEIHKVASLNDNLVVILHGGGDMETSSWISGAKAVLHAFYLGSSTSQALADILFGRCNPSGKLPFSMARSFSHYRSVASYVQDYDKIGISRIKGGQGDPAKRTVWDMPYTEELLVGYRLFDTQALEVAFPFGHGLSFTSFSYESLQVIKRGDGTVAVSLIVTNTGKIEGQETVQLYVHEEHPVVFRPEQELKQFEKINLAIGQSKEVSFLLTEEAFSHYDVVTRQFVRGEGGFELRLGSSSRDIRLRMMI